jgi:hypothetical protein
MVNKKAKFSTGNFSYLHCRKKADFNFEWLFAMVVGALILFLAVYGASKIGQTMRFEKDTEVAKQISILTDPLQAGFSSGKLGKIIFRQETRINNVCFKTGFGQNDISVATMSGVGEKWLQTGTPISIHNKYIFSKRDEGKEFYVFSKPFEFPFKVADLIMISSETYCFSDAPDAIKEELQGFNAPNLKFDNCTGEDREVCFSGNCGIRVYGDEEEGYVDKEGLKFNYVGNLLYAAIFSDKTIYECNVERLLYRTSSIAGILAEKADLMNSRECGTNMKPDLVSLAGMAQKADSGDLFSLNQVIKQIGDKNDRELCKVW